MVVDWIWRLFNMATTPVHHPVISTFYDLFLNCSLSIFKFLHSYLNLSSLPNPIKSTTYVDCNLFLDIYYKDPQNSPSKSSALQPLPVPTAHFHPLLCCNTPSFLHLPYSPPSKTIPISIHILTHLPSQLFIYLLFALIHTPFNLSFFFFVGFHT